MTLKLEIGKTYLNRIGGRVYIKNRIPGNYPYFSGKKSYQEDGRYLSNFQDDEDDLISEVKEEAPMKPANPYLTSMFEEVPATRKFVGVHTNIFSITQEGYCGKVFVTAEDHLDVAEMKDLILALEAAIVYLETQK